MASFLNSLQTGFLGAPGEFQQQSRLTGQQSNLINQQILPSLGPMLQQLQQRQGQGFEPIAQKARSQFNTQTIPSLAERFTSLGGQRSSAFQGALGSAGAGLEESLASLGSQYDLQNNSQMQNLLLSLLGLGTQPQFENLYLPGSQGVIHQILPALASLFGARFGG